MKQFFKEYIERIVPYVPGKPLEDLEREMGVSKALKLASNENLLGPSPKALKAARNAVKQLHLYPDGGSIYLKNRLAEEFNLEPDQFVIGNGSNEIIELLARGFLNEGDTVISSETSFLVYPLITQVLGATFLPVPMKGYKYDLQGILDRIDSRTRLIFIANPNNPTGTYVKSDELDTFLSRLPEDVIVCMDEAYIDFVEASDYPKLIERIASGCENLVLLRTFSKSYGLAGLRIGYGIGSKSMIGYLEKIRQPFNVNRIAQVAARAALDDTQFLKKTKQMTSKGKLYLYRELTKMNLEFAPSEANFVLIKVGVSGRNLFQAMLKRGIIVRPMDAYDLPTHIRVTVGKQSDMARFIRTLKAILKEGVYDS